MVPEASPHYPHCHLQLNSMASASQDFASNDVYSFRECQEHCAPTDVDVNQGIPGRQLSRRLTLDRFEISIVLCTLW